MKHSQDFLTVIIGEEQNRLRLDSSLAALCSDFSRARIQQLIEQGHVEKINADSAKTITKPSHSVNTNEQYKITIPAAEASDLQPLSYKLDVCYEDEHLLVINKPINMAVHPGANHFQDTLVNALLAHCGASLSGIGGVERPGIVHRLDKDTSGVMVVAKHDRAHRNLAEQIATRQAKRLYQAICWGIATKKQGIINTKIGRNPSNRQKMMVRRRDGREAITNYQVLEEFPAQKISLIECQLQTGRTHQIRVHLTHIGNPIIGDKTYGRSPANIRQILSTEIFAETHNFPRQALHAHQLSFIHPISNQPIICNAEMPADMQNLLQKLRQNLAETKE